MFRLATISKHSVKLLATIAWVAALCGCTHIDGIRDKSTADSTPTSVEPTASPLSEQEQVLSRYVSVTIPANSASATQATIVIQGAGASTTRCPALGVELTKLTITSLGGVDGFTGAMVSIVTPHSPAADAGIRQGDILLRIGNAGVNEPADVENAVAHIIHGSVTPVKLTRQARSIWTSVRF
jgi:S1-C subfamily serine protease